MANPPDDLERRLTELERDVAELRRKIAALERIIAGMPEHGVDKTATRGKVVYDWQSPRP